VEGDSALHKLSDDTGGTSTGVDRNISLEEVFHSSRRKCARNTRSDTRHQRRQRPVLPQARNQAFQQGSEGAAARVLRHQTGNRLTRRSSRNSVPDFAQGRHVQARSAPFYRSTSAAIPRTAPRAVLAFVGAEEASVGVWPRRNSCGQIDTGNRGATAHVKDPGLPAFHQFHGAHRQQGA